MANPQVVFEALLDLVQQIPDDEASMAFEVMQRDSAGVDLEAYHGLRSNQRTATSFLLKHLTSPVCFAGKGL